MDSFEHTGRFWLPGQEDIPVAGVLTFDPESGGKLVLIGALHTAPVIGTAQAVNRLILGRAGKVDVTLVGCNLLSISWDSPDWTEETWFPRVILRGACIEQVDKLAFDNVYFEVDALLEWTNRARITRNFRSDADRTLAGVVIQHDEVAAESVGLDDGATLGIRFPWAVEGDSERDATVRQTCVIERGWSSPQPLDDVLAEIRLFQHLLTIAVNKGCGCGSITLHHPDVVLQRPDHIYREPIEFFAMRDGHSPESPHPNNMLFRLDDLGGIDGLKRWRNVASKYGRALNMVTSMRYSPNMFGENKLANATGGAEALHRALFPAKAIADEAYKPIKRAMLRAVQDGTQREHLANHLRHANEPYLSARLRELASHAAPASDTVVGDTRRWARLVATVRNGLTHPEETDHERPTVTGSDLLFLSESVYLVIALCILREAGLKDESLIAATQRASVQWATKEIPAILERLAPLVD